MLIAVAGKETVVQLGGTRCQVGPSLFIQKGRINTRIQR